MYESLIRPLRGSARLQKSCTHRFSDLSNSGLGSTAISKLYRFRGKLTFCFLLGLCSAGWTGNRVGMSADQFAQPDQVKRDWQKYPAILEVDTKEDVYAIGDVHGDYDRLIDLLIAGKIIDIKPLSAPQVVWKAGKVVLVCTGDLIDKGDDSFKVITLFKALVESAAKAGGRVIVTMGNHEAGFLADPFNIKAKALRMELMAAKIDPAAVAKGMDKQGIGRFLRSLPLAVRVNDWFFAHAGNTGGLSLKQLDAELREGIDLHGFDITLVPSLRAVIEARLEPAVWWHRDGETAADSKARLASYLKTLGVRHLVIGHTPGKLTFPDQTVRPKGEMFQVYDGLLFLIDVGMSRGLDEGKGLSAGALLHISGGNVPKASAIYPNGPARLLWPAPAKQPQVRDRSAWFSRPEFIERVCSY